MLKHRTIRQVGGKAGAIAMLLAVVFVLAEGADKHNR